VKDLDIKPKKTLKDLRGGKPPFKVIKIASDQMEVAVVVLSADKIIEIDEQVDEYMESKGSKSGDLRIQIYNALLCHNAMRNPDNIDIHVSDSVSEVLEVLDMEDISRVINAYSTLMMNKAPKLELMTEKDLENVKKYLEVTPLSDLSTESLVHLANFRQTLPLVI
jgi:hypothetical protein